MSPSFKTKGLVLVDNLCLFSFIPLLKVCFRFRPVKIYYLQASKMGLQLTTWFKTLRVIVDDPIQVNNLYLSDTKDNVFLTSMFKALKLCLQYQEEINSLSNKVLTQYDSFFRQVCAVGVRKEWQCWLDKLLLQLNLARVLAREKKIPIQNVILISQFASLLKVLKVKTEISNNIETYSQPFENKAQLYLWLPVAYNMWQTITSFFGLLNPFPKKTLIIKNKKPVVGATAAWGLGLEGPDKKLHDDFFWWRLSKIPSEQLVCMFDRQNFQPTSARLIGLKKLGIKSIVLDPKYPGDVTPSKIKMQRPSFINNFKKCLFYSKLILIGLLGDQFKKSACSLIGWQIHKSEKLVPSYKKVNLKAVFHIHEPGLEFVNLAALQNDAARIGTHWSCLIAPSSSSPKCQEIFFVWGTHDLKIILDSGSISKNILVSGSPMTEQSHKKEFQKGKSAIKNMRNYGVRFTLALFDNSHPVPNFYRFFLQWLIDDPNLGLLIKTKVDTWSPIEKDGLEGLVEQAKKTGRLYVMDKSATPTDAALQTDFAIGVTSISAISVAALKGARVLYLDYENLDQGPTKRYSIFHSLGPNRCVFHNPESLKKAVMQYTNSPKSNPCLGDASPILDQLDPFRDGKASQRIGEFVSWYLEGLDQNFSKDSAIKAATDKYANKWGADKVIRNREIGF